MQLLCIIDVKCCCMKFAGIEISLILIETQSGKTVFTLTYLMKTYLITNKNMKPSTVCGKIYLHKLYINKQQVTKGQC